MKDPEIKLGRSITGKTISYKLGDLKSILIGGISGSGKSTLINNIIEQIKDDTQVFIIDLKRVCFLNYKTTCTVITDEHDIPVLLQKMCDFLEARYIEMEDAGTDKCSRPRVVLVVDEMADFMLKVTKKENNSYNKSSHSVARPTSRSLGQRRRQASKLSAHLSPTNSKPKSACEPTTATPPM